MKSEIILIGAGGHAKVCIELLRAMGKQVAYCVGETPEGQTCMDVPVLQGDDSLKRLKNEGYQHLFVAIGSNPHRARLAGLALDEGFQLVNAISPHAVISPTAQLGRGIAIMAGVVINAEAKIADLVILNTGATIDHDCHIESGAHIAPQCALAGQVKVGQQSFLGVGCRVIPQINIGNHVTVGAGSVVISDLQPQVTAVGVPAKVIKS